MRGTTVRKDSQAFPAVKGRALVSLALALGLWSGAAWAEAPADLAALERRIVEAPTPADLAAYAYRANPMIRAAREEWRASVERYRVDTALPDPEVMLEGMYMTDTLGEEFTPDEWTVGLSQAFPWPGALSEAGKAVRSEARMARLRLDASVRDVATQARESALELAYLREARKVSEANRSLLDQLRRAGETAYAANRAALLDVLKAQAQAGQLEYDDRLLAESEATETVRLNALLGRSPDAPVGSLAISDPVPTAYSLEETYALAEASLEELGIAREGVAKAEAMAEMARYETLPGFRLGLFYSKLEEARQVGVQAGLMLPLWTGKNAGRVAAARADVERMKAMRDNQANETRVMVRDAWFRLVNAERLVRLYRDDLVVQAARAVESSQTLYSQGQGTLTDAVEAQSALASFQLALARARADYGKSLARLEKLAGRSLTRREAAQ